jgi:TolA-binding protein
VATAYLGGLAAEGGDLERARELWQQFLAEAPQHLLAAEVRLNLLKLDLAQGKAEEVAAQLEAMLAESEKPLPEDVILFELAAVRERLGRTAEALAAYQRIVDEFPRSPFVREAQQKASALGDAA